MNSIEQGVIAYKKLPGYKAVIDETIQILQQTAREQDLLDGGTSAEIYKFTVVDAIHPGWGEDGDPVKNDVWRIFKKYSHLK